MARYRRGKKALYEVMSKTRSKSTHGKGAEPLRPAESKPTQQVNSKPNIPQSAHSARWRRTPRLFQLNSGRIEVSIPYQLAVALLLGLILLILVAFRLGQIKQRAANPVPRARGAEGTDTANSPSTRLASVPSPSRAILPAVGGSNSSEVTGDHVIVLVQYKQRSDLVPVQQYFSNHGIETEIILRDEWYFLITTNKYDNPEKEGTNGYFIKQKIIQLGANYKAPTGYESFGTKPFNDAYGMKIED